MKYGLVLHRIGELEMPSMGVIAVELKNLPKIFRMVKKFDQIAVICDRAWIRKGAEVERKLIAGLEMKSSGLNQEDKAGKWLGAWIKNNAADKIQNNLDLIPSADS